MPSWLWSIFISLSICKGMEESMGSEWSIRKNIPERNSRSHENVASINRNSFYFLKEEFIRKDYCLCKLAHHSAGLQIFWCVCLELQLHFMIFPSSSGKKTPISKQKSELVSFAYSLSRFLTSFLRCLLEPLISRYLISLVSFFWNLIEKN